MIIKCIVFITLFSIVWSYEVAGPGKCNPFGCKCQNGTEFFISKDGCISCRCKLNQCSVNVCIKKCKNGFEYDKAGCPICKCLKPCANVTCPQSSACVVQKSNCTNFSADCQPYNGVCKSCTALFCYRTACQYGFVYIAEKCPVCECLDPCANVNCPPGKSCVPEETMCKTYSADCQQYKGVCKAA